MRRNNRQEASTVGLLDSCKKFYELSSRDRFGIPTRCLAVPDFYGTYSNGLDYTGKESRALKLIFALSIILRGGLRLMRCLVEILILSVMNRKDRWDSQQCRGRIKAIYLSNNHSSVREEIEYFDSRGLRGVKLVVGCEEGSLVKAMFRIKAARDLGASLITGLDCICVKKLVMVYRVVAMDAIEAIGDIVHLCMASSLENQLSVLRMTKGLWSYDYINGLLLNRCCNVEEAKARSIRVEIWWEGQASNYYLLGWALKNSVHRVLIKVIGIPSMDGYPMLLPMVKQREHGSFSIRQGTITIRQDKDYENGLTGWRYDGSSWPDGNSVVASGHSATEVEDSIRLGLFLDSMGIIVRIKIHPHYKRRNERLVEGLITRFSAGHLVDETSLDRLIQKHTYCYCNLDSVSWQIMKSGKVCIPVVSERYPTFMRRPGCGNAEVDMSSSIPKLRMIESGCRYDVPYRFARE